MENFKAFLVVSILLISSLTAFSQRRLGGKVVEVIDGKTAVVEIGTSGKLKVVLQNIETPEPEQPLHGVVREHLEKILLGKTVSVFPKGIVSSLTIAQIFVGDVDVSQQMLRDGAAWYSAAENTDAKKAENEIYLSNEAQAKTEKRGVWSVEGLKPAWEFRAEKDQRDRVAELAKQEEIRKQNLEKYPRAEKKKLPPPSAMFSNFEMWKSGRTPGIWDEMQLLSDKLSPDQNGLIINRIPQYNVAFILTSQTTFNLSSANLKPKMKCQAGYFSIKDKSAGEKENFGFACIAESEKESFKSSNALTFIADGKKINSGKAIQFGQQSDKKVMELLVYTLERESFVKIAAAKDVKLTIGNFSGAMPEKFQSMIKNLVFESTKDIK